MHDPSDTGGTAPGRGADAGHVVVVADGDVAERAAIDAAWPGWDAGVGLVIAADGGFRRARLLGLAPGLLVGDLDSLDPLLAAEVAASGIPVLRSRTDKDESDTELALLQAARRGPARVTVLGAFGGPRLDHALANVWLLAHPGLEGVEVSLLDARTRVRLVSARGPSPAQLALPGPVGGVVSLLPLGGDAEGITTRGLAYPLRGEPLRTGPARGLSNVRTAVDASLQLERGRLLVIESAGTAPAS